jgi:multisubunit Na+/H+ antiporter MnhE subunit
VRLSSTIIPFRRDPLGGAALYVSLVRIQRYRWRTGPLRGLLRSFAAFFPFAGAVVRDVVEGTWEVALVTLHFRPLVSPGIVKVPVGERTSTGVAVSALVTTLSPGAFLIEANEDFMLLHVIDAADPDAVREKHEDFYQRYQRKVFP